jgi:hypothetical protein
VKRLRIVLFGESDNFVLLDPNPTAGFVNISDGKILEIPLAHTLSAPRGNGASPIIAKTDLRCGRIRNRLCCRGGRGYHGIAATGGCE